MKKKFSFVVIFFIAGIVLAVLISISAVREAYRSKTIEKEVQALQQEADRIAKENDLLGQRIAYFETSDFQEKIAKEKLNLQKTDESVVVVKPGAQKEQQQEVAIEEDVQPQAAVPNYQKWWNFFFKY
ncbi:MAG: septum formation initiator family protein [bacterium]